MNTDRIYEYDSTVSEFDATILRINVDEDKERIEIVLDRTAFFPEGGGQKSDTGYIGDLRVSDVQIVDGDVIHYVDFDTDISFDSMAERDVVKCRLDYEIRFHKMQNHTAEHLFCGLIHERFGYDNVGFHIDGDEVTFDVDGKVETEELKEIERKANETVYKNVPVRVTFPKEDELCNLEYRSKLELTENVRIVTIEGVDVCACCAPHVNRTGEIGLIKIIDSFFHRGGTRIIMKAGLAAYEDYLCLDENTRKIMALLSAKRADTAQLATELDERYRSTLGVVSELKKKLTGYVYDKIAGDIKGKSTEKPYTFFTNELDDVGLRNLINELTVIYDGIVVGFLETETGFRYIAATKKPTDNMSLKELAAIMSKELNGRGGGSEVMVQGMVSASQNEIINVIEKSCR